MYAACMRCSSLRPVQHSLTRTAEITGQVPAFSGKQNKLSYTGGNVLGNSEFPHQLSLGFYLAEPTKESPRSRFHSYNTLALGLAALALTDSDPEYAPYSCGCQQPQQSQPRASLETVFFQPSARKHA